MAAAASGGSYDWRDAWFVGYTPQIVAGTWFGIDGPPIISLGEHQWGNLAAVPVWAKFMKTAHDTLGLPEKEFIRPNGVLEMDICSLSKKLPIKGCPTEKEIFIRGTEPIEYCEKHWVILVGSFRDRKDADLIVDRLKKAYYSVEIKEKKNLFLVQVLQYPTIEDALIVGEKIKKEFGLDFRVLKRN